MSKSPIEKAKELQADLENLRQAHAKQKHAFRLMRYAPGVALAAFDICACGRRREDPVHA